MFHKNWVFFKKNIALFKENCLYLQHFTTNGKQHGSFKSLVMNGLGGYGQFIYRNTGVYSLEAERINKICRKFE